MSAATLTRSASAPSALDRLVLGAGLRLVTWSRKRTAKRVRMHVAGAETGPLTAAERTSRLVDPYSATAVHGRGLPPTRIL